MVALLIAVLFVATFVTCMADTPDQASPTQSSVDGKLEPQSRPLIQCNVGLGLPLLLAGLVTIVSRTNFKRKK